MTPGEMFTLSAVLVGDDFGTVTGSVYASSINKAELKFHFAQGQDSSTSSAVVYIIQYIRQRKIL